jgi:outer membrane protein TolC
MKINLPDVFCGLLLFATSLLVNATAVDMGNLTLEECIRIALQKHQSLQVSEANVLMAEAQYQQAMSAYWPQLNVDVNASRADQARTFTFQGAVELPPQLSGALAQLGAQPVKSLPINMEIKLFDRDLLTASVNLTYPVFTGGKRGALVGQANKGIQIAEQGHRKSKLEIIRDVKRFYHGAQFALKMEQLGKDTLARFEILEELTERLYQHGSLKVKKTDYLRIKTTTAITRSMLHEAEYARQLAHEALSNAMGLQWDTKLSLTRADQPQKMSDDLQSLITAAKDFNPDVQQLSLAVQAVEYKIMEARSGYFPVVGFQASAHKLWNDFDGGLVNETNREGWTIGVGLQWSLFDGFRTAGKVDHAKASRRKIESQQILLDQGMALQIKQQFLRLQSASKQIDDTLEAFNYASENRKLHVRAYQEDMVETKDVIEAQIIETFAHGAQLRSRHTMDLALTLLEFLVGENIQELQ